VGLESLVIAGTLAMLALSGGIVWFVILYQRRVIQSHIDIERINREKQQEMMNASIQSEEQERMRIAAELHDDIAPTLASVKLYLSAALLKNTETEQHAYVEQSKSLLDESLQKIRDIAHKLQPSTLYYLGLQVSLQALADMINNSGGLEVSYTTEHNLPRFRENIELSLYRVTQELLNNIIKHAHARLVTIETRLDNEAVYLSISHNGTGITQQLYEELVYKKGAIGLKNIVTRLKSIEGAVHFEQVSVSLFTITIQAPIKEVF
jgi:two-component system, NarL family, sensor kinase